VRSSTQSPPYAKSSGLLSIFLIVAGLYLARELFILIALAIFFAFLLEPLANQLERLRLGKIGAAIAAVLAAMIIAATFTELVIGQLGEFGHHLPDYKKNLHDKLVRLEGDDGGVFGRTAKSFQDFRKDLIPTNSAAGTNAVLAKTAGGTEEKPVPVEVRNAEISPLQIVEKLLGPLLNVLTTLCLVTIFCIFMLSGREDLRDRLVRITGARNARLTNQLLDETGHRVSRYLVMQLVVNVSYGVPIGLGLWCIGIPTPLLWGMVASLFRYIPYAGPWMAACLPLAVGIATTSGWSAPFLVLGLFGFVEIITANFIEPWLYGNSTGITPLAVLLSAVFWAWIWGPIGLLLSMPLTVCLVSIGRYFPQLELLVQLFGESDTVKRRPARTPPHTVPPNGEINHNGAPRRMFSH